MRRRDEDMQKVEEELIVHRSVRLRRWRRFQRQQGGRLPQRGRRSSNAIIFLLPEV